MITQESLRIADEAISEGWAALRFILARQWLGALRRIELQQKSKAA